MVWFYNVAVDYADDDADDDVDDYDVSFSSPLDLMVLAVCLLLLLLLLLLWWWCL